MLTALSIRDLVLIERLDLVFGPGLTVLTGETGAGKSILLDGLGLALGARAEAGLLRGDAAQASVSAMFAPPPGHPALALAAELGIAAGEEIVLRRVLTRDGRSRAFVNDQPVGASLLRRFGAALVEIQGQHDQLELADPARHAVLLDAAGIAAELCDETEATWEEWQKARALVAAARAALAEAEREEEYLRHAVDELAILAPRAGEEEVLAAERTALQQAERRGEAIATALAELSPGNRRTPGPAAALRAASRALGRLSGPLALPAAESALAALSRAEEAVAEAETVLSHLAEEAEADPRALERAEERLFALRAAARKYAVPVAELPSLLASLRERLAALDAGTTGLVALERDELAGRARFVAAGMALGAARARAAEALERAVGAELGPLRLGRARFLVELAPLAEADWGPRGAERVQFLVATNPGEPAGPLERIASGGELSRLMLALRLVLARASPIATLVFDEVDSGIGGATAAAVGERLARLAERMQVLVVTHSPQVAARGGAHFAVAKRDRRGRAHTEVAVLEGEARREEIARMLAGETITEAARAAAESLLGSAA